MLYINVRHSKMHTKAIFGGLGLVIFSALIVLIMTAPSGAVMNEQQATAAATSQPISYIPNPTMNTNVTWSTFYNGWSPLEYNNGTTNLTLNTGLSTAYANPISVNPAKISGIAGIYAPSEENTSWAIANGRSIATGATATVGNASGKETLTLTGSDSGTSLQAYHIEIPVTALPSSNPQYDYFTIIFNTSGKTVTGERASIYLTNDTNHGSYGQAGFYTPDIYGTGDQFLSFSLSSLTTNVTKYGDMNISANSYYTLGISLAAPNGTAGDSWSTTLQAFMLTENQPYLGSNSTSPQVSQGTGSIQLTSFNPDFTWSKITNSGYSVAVSQLMQNTTESQSSITSGNYIEQATYQGILSLPTAPDLTYAETNITINMVIPGKQFEVANLNGVSYLSNIQSKTNGTFGFGAVNPQAQNSLILEIQYTASQWNASTSPPSFFSIQGIEYYWWVGVIGLLSIVGLGAAASSHFSGEEESLKVPKGKFGR